ncbi:antibiotic biosynthesis monooxygenase [Streptacidiphilus rugosus]|uniref:antibiotic biosynthesis monooxygenase n=1 Tax=Streptacidiphilus rugosus TaxID=405783 RepID=UPI0007C86C6D|nr:antibiotic biosynthesis monooxygenase [Streptacidiphilus rugosus]
MINWVLVEANLSLPAEHEAKLIAAYHRLVAQPHPDGLLQTELLRGQDGHWRVQTLWRDRTSMEAMRASPMGSTAPRLFHDLDIESTFDIFDVVDEWITPQPEIP